MPSFLYCAPAVNGRTYPSGIRITTASTTTIASGVQMEPESVLTGSWVGESARSKDGPQNQRLALSIAKVPKLPKQVGTAGFASCLFYDTRGYPKRHIVVDTVGNLLEVVVHAANIQEYHAAKVLLDKLTETVSALERIWADGMYGKAGLVEWVQDSFSIVLDIVNGPPEQQGFAVLPRRWVVERTFAWLGRYRRLSKDYEHSIVSSEGTVYLASIHTMLRRIAARS